MNFRTYSSRVPSIIIWGRAPRKEPLRSPLSDGYILRVVEASKLISALSRMVSKFARGAVYSDCTFNLLIYLGGEICCLENALKLLRIRADFDSTIPTQLGAGSLFGLIARIGCPRNQAQS